MEYIKWAGDLIKEIGVANFALLAMVGAVCWFIIRILPAALERIVVAVESLGKTFATHDERSVAVYDNIGALATEVRELSHRVATKEDIAGFHARLEVHAKDCQDRSRDLANAIKK